MLYIYTCCYTYIYAGIDICVYMSIMTPTFGSPCRCVWNKDFIHIYLY